MSEEMQLMYLYFLTKMNSGTERWNECYEAWDRLGNSMDSEEYSEAIERIRAFHKKYAVKKKKS